VTLQQKSVLLFDLDGTLVDSAPDLALALNKTLSELKLAECDESLIRSWVGNGAKVLVERALEHSSNNGKPIDASLVNDALVKFLYHYQQCLCVNSALYSDVKKGLSLLKASGFRLAIITNKAEGFIAPILSGLGIDGLFEILIGGDTLAEKKPHPAPLNYVLQQLNVTAQQCIMIGDSRNDILAAKAAKIESIGLTYGYNYGEDIRKYEPNWCFDNFADLTAAFQ
jgi:phosphoglycolate phosphatase